MGQKRRFSKKEIKQAFSPKATKGIVQAMQNSIKDRRIRDEAIAMVRALDLKKIRNTSKT